MIEIRYVQTEDKEFWYSLDRHLPEPEFENKVSNKRGYIIFDDNKPIGLLRYNLFWDNTPFCTMLFIDWNYQGTPILGIHPGRLAALWMLCSFFAYWHLNQIIVTIRL